MTRLHHEWSKQTKDYLYDQWCWGVSAEDITPVLDLVPGMAGITVMAVTTMAGKLRARRPKAMIAEKNSRSSKVRWNGRRKADVDHNDVDVGATPVSESIEKPKEKSDQRDVFVDPVKQMDDALLIRLDRPKAVVDNVTPTAKPDPSTKKVPYKMASSEIDPFRAARLQQVMRGSAGRL